MSKPRKRAARRRHTKKKRPNRPALDGLEGVFGHGFGFLPGDLLSGFLGFVFREFIGAHESQIRQARLRCDWRRVLNLQGAATRELVQDRFLELAKVRHPDKGGSHAGFIELVAARDAALEELSSRQPYA